MAELTRRRARMPLAQGPLNSLTWNNFRDEGERFIMAIGVAGDFRLHITRTEAQQFIADMTKMLADPELASAAGVKAE